MMADALDIMVATPCPAWVEADADCEDRCQTAARAALAAAPLDDDAALIEVGIRLSDDAELRDLNNRFRQIDAATNVLSFPLGDDAPLADGQPRALGDVVLAFETVSGEAAAQGKSLADHLSHLVVHGLLHLLGHDHLDAAEGDAMERLETDILAGLGIADPYGPGPDRRRA